jgi:hypothetical protein
MGQKRRGSPQLAFRADIELVAWVLARAAMERRQVSELLRDAVEAYRRSVEAGS